MDNAHDQPLPPGVQSLPNYSTNPAPYPPPQHFDYAARPQYHSSNTGNYVFPLPYSNSTFTPTTQSSYPHNGPSNGYAPQWSGHIPNNFHNGYASQLGSVQHGAYLIEQQPQNQTAVGEMPLHKDNQRPQDMGHFDGNDQKNSDSVYREPNSNFSHKEYKSAVDVPDAPTSNLGLHVKNDNEVETAAQDAVLREQVHMPYDIYDMLTCFITLYMISLFLFGLTGNCHPKCHTKSKVRTSLSLTVCMPFLIL